MATKLALTLLRLIKRIGKTGGAGILITPGRQELAQTTGTAIFMISRILSKWAEKGLVKPLREPVLISYSKRPEMGRYEDD